MKKKDTRNYGKFHPRFAEGGSVDADWHKQATVEAEKLGPSASGGRANPVLSDDFFKKIPGIRGVVDSYNAMREVEADPNSSFGMLRQLQRDK